MLGQWAWNSENEKLRLLISSMNLLTFWCQVISPNGRINKPKTSACWTLTLCKINRRNAQNGIQMQCNRRAHFKLENNDAKPEINSRISRVGLEPYIGVSTTNENFVPFENWIFTFHWKRMCDSRTNYGYDVQLAWLPSMLICVKCNDLIELLNWICSRTKNELFNVHGAVPHITSVCANRCTIANDAAGKFMHHGFGVCVCNATMTTIVNARQTFHFRPPCQIQANETHAPSPFI